MMNLFQRLFRRETAKEPSAPSVSSASHTDRTVYVRGEVLAMKLAAVYSAVDLLSSTVAKLPLQYLRRNVAQGIFVDYEESPLYYLIARRPSRRHTAYQFWKNVVQAIYLRGNAYVVPRREVSEITELVLVSPFACSYDILADKYTITDPINALQGTFSADEVLHFKNVSSDGGYTGRSTISYAADVLSLQATADTETRRRFAQGGTFKALFTNDNSAKGFGDYTDEALAAAAEDIQTRLNSGDDIISVPGDGKLQQLSMSSTDLQYLENRKFGVREICRFFRVPPSKIYDDFNKTYGAGETANVEFLLDSIDPILTNIEQELAAKLIVGSAQTCLNYRFEFDREKLFTTNLETRADYQQKTIASGVYSVNDWRRKENRPAVEGGDRVMITCNVAPVDSPKITGETVIGG